MRRLDWGNESRHLAVMFNEGRYVAVYFTNLGTTLTLSPG